MLGTLMAAGGAAADSRSGDFDGDGFDDLAVGIQGQDAGGVNGAGGVHVIFGSASGLSRRDRVITRATRGVAGAPGQDGFGSVVAAGDFDGDGFDDLAVGAPFDAVGGVLNAGSVHVLYGSRRGPSGKRDRILAHGRPGLGPAGGPFEGFGWTLAVANLAGDRRDDLAVTTINGPAGGVDDAGYVEVLPGGPRGLTGRGRTRLSRASAGVAGDPVSFEAFGYSLAAGEMGGSRRVDLAIGARRAQVDAATDAGSVFVLFGRRRGPSGRGSQYLDQLVLHGGLGGVDTEPEQGDTFGAALAAGEFGRGPRDDLAIGAPGEDYEEDVPIADSGLVSIGFGGRDGIRTGASGSPNVFNESMATGVTFSAGAQFGHGLAAANVGYNAHDDLLAGAYGSAPNGGSPAGAVAVIYGGPDGFEDSHSLYQDMPSVEDFGETGDFFGWALGAGRFDGRGPADLAVGVHGESLAGPTIGLARASARGEPGPPPLAGAGAVAIFRGTGLGITVDGDRLIHQGAGGLGGEVEAGDNFGIALSGPATGGTWD